MPFRKIAIFVFALMFLSSGLSAITTAQADSNAQKDGKDKKAEKRKSVDEKADKKDFDDLTKGNPELWREPTDIESRDLFYGPGGREGAPNPSGRFTFVRRSASGTSEKIIVEDDKGRSWTVKFGPEAKPEVTATRIVWAAGYHADQDYFVDRTHIEGRGGFDIWDVRFERRDEGLKELGEWSWTANPFMGQRELQGLRALMALLNNWDLKDVNNKVVRPNKESGGDRSQHIYYVSDLGATFGSTGNSLRKIPFFSNAPAGTKGEPADYSNQAFIDGVSNGEVVFHYKGKNPDALKGIKVEHARWMGNLLGRLSDKQLSDAFRAGGFNDSEIAVYVKAIRNRINQLQNLK